MSELETAAAPAAGAEPAVVEAAVTATEAPAETIAAPSWEESMEAVYDRMNQPRDNGKFVAKDNGEAPAEQAVETAEQSTDQPEKVDGEPAQPAITAPHSWSAEMKAKFGALPPDVQKYVMDREGEAHKAITQNGQQIKALEPIRNVIEQHRNVFQRHNVNEADGIAFLLRAQDNLDQNPVAAIAQIAKTYGVDLSKFAQPNSEDSQQSPNDPRVAALERELFELKNNMNASQRAAHDVRMTEAAREISDFSKDKTHWADVEQDMLTMVPHVKAANPSLSNKEVLEKAYEQATWANPTIRQRILEDQRKAEEAKRQTEAEKKAKDAKTVAALNVKPGKGASPSVKRSWDDTMSEVYDRLQSA